MLHGKEADDLKHLARQLGKGRRFREVWKESRERSCKPTREERQIMAGALAGETLATISRKVYGCPDKRSTVAYRIEQLREQYRWLDKLLDGERSGLRYLLSYFRQWSLKVVAQKFDVSFQAVSKAINKLIIDKEVGRFDIALLAHHMKQARERERALQQRAGRDPRDVVGSGVVKRHRDYIAIPPMEGPADQDTPLHPEPITEPLVKSTRIESEYRTPAEEIARRARRIVRAMAGEFPGYVKNSFFNDKYLY